MGEPSRIAGQDGLRADARRNRERVLAAARLVFAEHGIDAPMATVARRAGVGVATLYRRFPTRDALVRAAFAHQMETCARALTEALADPDPWQGFQRLVETVCELQREERGFPAAFVAAFPDSTREHAPARERAERDFMTLVGRAQAAGALRADFHPSDLAVALLSHCALVTALPGDHAASRRLVAYLLQSFRTEAAHGTLPPPSTLSLRSLPLTPARACLTIPVVARRTASRRQARALGVPGTGPRTGCTWVCARCGERACMASRGRRELSDRP